MRKKIALALSMILMILMLGACGTDPTTVDYNGHSYEDLQNDSNTSIVMVQQLAEVFKQYDKEDVADSLKAQYGVTDEQIEASEKWTDAEDEFGNYVETKDDTFTVTKSGKTLTSDVTLKFEKKDVDFQVVYDYYSMEITGLTVEPIYSLGHKLQNAALNTVISMSVVFAVLILISLLISCFKIFPYLEQKKAAKAVDAASTAPAQDQIVSQISQREEQQLTDDTELVAVIAAAIAASTGTSTSDFVVRSINRR